MRPGLNEPLGVPCGTCARLNPAAYKYCGGCGEALAARCPTCASNNEAGTRFCVVCSASLLVTCGQCQATAPVGQRICGSCGLGLVVSVSAGIVAEVTARAVTEQESEPPTATAPVEEERRWLTALFCDLVGFTPLTESLDPEEVREIQTLYFNAMSRELQRFGGSVEKYAGDAVLALFGTPVAHEDDPERAVRCALAMQEAFQEVVDFAMERAGKKVALRIGVNSGELVSGSWDINGRIDYSATGDALNTAARLQTACEPGGVIVGQETMLMARRAIVFGPRQDLTLKGKSDLFPAYPVIGLRAQLAERWETAGQRTPLVGREPELARMSEVWRRVRAGHGRIVTLVADAGVGKSRLVAEATESMASVAGTVIVRGRAVSYGDTMSLHLIADLLRNICQIREGEPIEQVRTTLRITVDSLLARWDVDTRRSADDVLGSVLGLPSSPSPVGDASPQVRRQVLVRSLQLLLSALSNYRPLIVLLEDLHWSDAASLEVLDSVIPGLEECQALMLVTRRPSKAASWEDRANSDVIMLHPLDDRCATELVRFLAGTELEPEVEQVIADRAGGNPFFIEELLRSMRETDAFVEREGRLGLTAGAADKIPPTLTELLLARLDQLERPARSAAQYGSVIGRTFAVPVLSLVTERRADDLMSPLDSLERAEIALPRRNPEQEYVFKHVTIRDVAYNTLLLRRRRALHAATARAIIRLYSPDEYVDVIAYHFSQTREHADAWVWLERSGDHAAGIFANALAIDQYREARRRQDLARASSDDRARVDEKLGHILRVALQFEEALTALESAAELYRSVGDIEGVRRVTAETGRLFRAQGKPGLGIVRIEELLNEEADGPPTSGLAELYVALARLYYNAGRYQEQLRAAGRGSEMAAVLGNRRVLAEAEMSRSVGLYHLRRTEDALQAMDAAIPVAEEAGDFESLSNMLANTAMISRDAGEFERSRAYRERSANIAERIGDIGWYAAALSNLGELLFCLGEWEEAQLQLERAMEIVRPLGPSWFSPHGPVFLAQLHAARGEFDKAQSYLEEPLTIAREGGNRLLLLVSVAFLAEAELLRGDPVAAIARLEEIMDFSDIDEEDTNLTGVLPIAASALIESGDAERGVALARLGVQRAKEEQATLEVMTLLRVVGAAEAARGNWSAAREALDQSLALAREMRHPYGEVRILFEYGKLHALCGEAIEARSCFETARTLATRLGAQPYVERTQRALAELLAV